MTLKLLVPAACIACCAVVAAAASATPGNGMWGRFRVAVDAVRGSGGGATGANAGAADAFARDAFGALAGLLAVAGVLQCVFGGKVGSNAKEHAFNDDAGKEWYDEYGVSKLVDRHTAKAENAKRAKRAAKSKSGAAAAPLPKYTTEEVAKHCTKEDCWIIIGEMVYDVTPFVEQHPGGIGPMVALAGKDCTDVFANYHSARVYKYMLPRYIKGQVVGVEVPDHVEDFRKVRQELLRRGLFETDYRFYGRLGCWLGFLLAAALSLTLWPSGEGALTYRLIGAAVMGVFWQQLAGLGHDLGHSGVTHNFHLDHRIGSSLSSLMGLSTCWWKSDHNTHHVVCNAVEHDPNIQYLPLIAVTPHAFAKGPTFSTYHKRWMGMDRVARALVSYQHIFFYPVMAVARINLYIQGLIYLIAKPDTIHYRSLELCSLTVFFSWVGFLVSCVPGWRQRLLWVLVSHGVAGVLHVQIVLSHFAMRFYMGRAYNDAEDEWYVTQLKTTMNVDTWEWFDCIHIGLQFQIEHHLYPRLPRHNLREARRMILPICKKYGFDYHEPGFFRGNYEMWRQLKDTAMVARKATRGDGGFYESALWEGMNLSG